MFVFYLINQIPIMKILISKNVKTFFICFSFLLVTSHVVAQEKASVEKSQFKINVLLPGIAYEHGLSDKNTLYSEFSLGFGYRKSSFYGSGWSFYPVINEQFRHYYNLEKRASKGKVTSNNSGGFVAVNAIYNFKSMTSNETVSSSNSSLVLAPVWGFQRTYKGNFNLGFNAGVGYYFSNNDNGITPVLNFSLGWVIGK